MKLSIIYFSQSGNTKEMAQIIAKGMKKVDGVDVGIFDLENIDRDFVTESRAVVFGTPTYLANMCWQLKKWLDEESGGYKLEGKIGAVFATANFAQGGADTAILSVISHLMVRGMLVYSSGTAFGQPYIHLGALAVKENFEQSKPMFELFGERIAKKANHLFGDKK